MPIETSWIDISVPLRTGMVHWPGDTEPSFRRVSSIGDGAGANVTECRMSAHTGTHMDAPGHFLESAPGIDTFPLEIGIGPAKVIQIDPNAPVIDRNQIRHGSIGRGDRILFRTRNSEGDWHDRDFDRGYVGLDHSAAEFLVSAGVLLVGVDYLSVGVFAGDGVQTHKTLLSAGIWILEGLSLQGIEPGNYDLICLPLPIVGSDGSPARAALRKHQDRA